MNEPMIRQDGAIRRFAAGERGPPRPEVATPTATIPVPVPASLAPAPG